MLLGTIQEQLCQKFIVTILIIQGKLLTFCSQQKEKSVLETGSRFILICYRTVRSDCSGANVDGCTRSCNICVYHQILQRRKCFPLKTVCLFLPHSCLGPGKDSVMCCPLQATCRIPHMQMIAVTLECKGQNMDMFLN